MAVLACQSKKVAEHANSLAETANQTAAAAVAAADEANRLAVEANQLSCDANTISERALTATTDHLRYHWQFQVDDQGSAVVINDCAHVAEHVTVVVDSGGQIHTSFQRDHVARFEELRFDLSGVITQHLEHVRDQPVAPSTAVGPAFQGRARPPAVTTLVRATIGWSSQVGVQRSDTVEDRLTHRVRRDGTVERLHDQP